MALDLDSPLHVRLLHHSCKQALHRYDLATVRFLNLRYGLGVMTNGGMGIGRSEYSYDVC
jgi:hypothetical protein